MAAKCAFTDCDERPVDGLLCAQHRVENKLAELPSDAQQEIDRERDGR